MRLFAHYMLDNKCKGTSMCYIITKGVGGDRSENGNFGLRLVLKVITKERRKLVN